MNVHGGINETRTQLAAEQQKGCFLNSVLLTLHKPGIHSHSKVAKNFTDLALGKS